MSAGVSEGLGFDSGSDGEGNRSENLTQVQVNSSTLKKKE